MNGAYDIDVWGLVLALGMVAAAAIISELMHMGIGRTLMWSACRALVQLWLFMSQLLQALVEDRRA